MNDKKPAASIEPSNTRVYAINANGQASPVEPRRRQKVKQPDGRSGQHSSAPARDETGHDPRQR